MDHRARSRQRDSIDLLQVARHILAAYNFMYQGPLRGGKWILDVNGYLVSGLRLDTPPRGRDETLFREALVGIHLALVLGIRNKRLLLVTRCLT